MPQRADALRAITAVAACIAMLPARAEPILTTVVQKYCSDCHSGDDEGTSDVRLTGLTATDLAEDANLVQRLIGVIDRREMPPEDSPQPSAEDHARLLHSLRIIEREAVPATQPLPPSIRRMTRFQYNNAVTDLFQLKCAVFTLPERLMRSYPGSFRPETGKMAAMVRVGNRPLGKSQLIEPRLAGVAAFPQDLRAEHGYDNQADHLSLSPLLMEAFLTLGQSITESPDFGPKNVGIWQSFFAAPQEDDDLDAQLHERLRRFLSKAFRQPIDEPTLNRYVAYASGCLQSGTAFPTVMKSLAAAVLASPRFLYLYSGVPHTGGSDPEQGRAAADLALASRLSFFLWGSLPDEQLVSLATSGELKKPDALAREVERMLSDHRIKRFCDSFPAQWLQLDRLISSTPDRDSFPNFYFSKYRTSMHMMLEPLLLFETVLIENRPITDLIDPDFSYRSLHLEKAYKNLATPTDQRPEGPGGGVTALSFHRVPITDRRSGGVITNAAVMTMTSGTKRTKPITRGAWVASVIFNAPPPPPPADVPPLDEHPAGDEANLTLRERLAMHRERADCRGCHNRIDPFGFALENYDPVGTWRDSYTNGREIDASGSLFRTRPFSNPVEFKDAILVEKDRFTKALAGHLLTFALARELTAADQLAVQEIADRTAAEGYRLHALLREVVLSRPFCETAYHAANPLLLSEEHEP